MSLLITYNGFFDEGLEWVGIENFTIVASSSHTSRLSIRFSSLLHIYNLELPEKEDLHVICSSYLQNTLKEITSSNESWLKRKLGKLASTMISIYNEVKETLKSNEYRHYGFSPHEITSWCHNLLRYKIEIHQGEPDDFIIEIVCREALQILGSRLVSDTDRNKLNAILNNIFLSDWGKSYITDKVSSSFYIPNFTSTRSMSVLSKIEGADWFSTVKKGVMLYEREGHILNLLFIPELLNLIAALSRSLTKDAGSVLLVGSSGVGRKSAVRIASALQSAKLVIPNSLKSFNNDLKYATQQSGIEGENVILILEDHLFNDATLNVISILLSSGEVPGLYNQTEFESLISGLRDEASREGFEGNLGDYFVERVRKKLHVVICLDTKNDQLWEILADYPVLHQHCDVIWQSEWSTKTMESVPNMLIDKHNKENPNELIELSSGFSNIHKSVESSGKATPLCFIELIKNYIRFYVEKKNLVVKKKSKLQVGVDKLTEARSIVADLKLKAAEQQEKLAEKQSKANAALDMISNTMEHANTQKQEMEVLKRNTENENEQLVKRKREIELELAEVEPLIKEAAAAVGNIKAESLSEIRSLRAPPDIIRDILEGVLRLMGIQDTSWNSMKTFLAKRGVKEDIRSFDASRITTENRHAVEKLLQNRSDSFEPKSSKRASVAAAPLAAWVTANVRYSHVLDKIKPLTKEQTRLQRNLETAKHQLGELSSGLTNVDATVAKLKEQLSTYTKEAAEIEIHLGMAQETLRAAEGLVDKLNDEFNRWQIQLSELSEEIKRLPSYCLLAAAFVTYLSEEPEDLRLNLLETWKQIIGQTVVNQFTLEEFLSSERENLQWQSEGLGSDQLSIQNAIIMLNIYIIPLVIDPTSVAFQWIKQHFKNKTLETINENSPKFNTVLELAIRFGKTLIVEDVNHISSILLPVLRKEFVYAGERKMININGKLIDCHNDFRLILTSRNSQFKLPAYLCSAIVLVNFSITHSGLTEKLLIGAIRQENPQLEERRKQLLKDREEMQEKQYNLQNQLLEDLANSSGNILENKSLLESLNETKASSNAISEALQQSSEVRQKLSEEYEIYKDISAFGSSLYFAIVEFSKMNVLYSISVHSYTKLFLKSLSSSQGIENTFGLLQRVLVQSVYQFVGRGVFKADRLKFIVHLIHAIYPKCVPDEEWNFFLGQITSSKVESKPESNVPNWIPEQLHHQVLLLQVHQPNIFIALNLSESTAWKDFMNVSKCEAKFPQHVKLTEFQKILVIQILRPDRLYSALTQFCLHVTGLKNLNMDVLQLSQILQESSCFEPILLLTTSGNDPSAEIRELAESKRGNSRYIEIAMGEGQEVKAVSNIREANENGHWIILKNLHLVTSWLPILLQELQNLKPNQEFRMWLITESQNSFNLVLVQNSLKIAYEAPQGVRNNLLRTYANWGSDYVQNLKPTNARIFFILACINALLQERRTYIPQGWSKWYDFSDVDLTAAVKLTTPALSSNNSQVPWKFLKGLCADAVYGGRVENIQDFSILESYLNEYFTDEVLSHRWKPFDLSNSIRLSTKYDDYVNAILQLSDRDLPSYFGLSENIDRSWEKNISKEVIADLRALEGDKVKHSTFNRLIWQKGLAPYITLWKKLNQGQDFVKIAFKPFVVNFEQSPILNFIQEEFHNAVFLIQKIHKNFTALNRLLRASTLPDDKTSELAISLLNQKVPKSWSKVWDGPTDPNKYLRYVIVKTVKIRNWQSEQINYFFTVPMNLSLLFNPETFLAAFKQHYSRGKVPLDELMMQTNWKITPNSVILEGLLISGALFDGFLLSACSASTESINPVPNCYITWIHKKNAVINDKFINVPLYYTSDRDKQVTQIQVPCDLKEKDKWIKTGLAFFLSY
ncbi:btv [Trypoxylus dichotomus]